MPVSSLPVFILAIASGLKARFVDPVARLFHTSFPEAWLLEGVEKESGQPLKVLLFGDRPPFNYTALTIFKELPGDQSLGRTVFWRWRSLMRRHRADLFYGESTLFLALRLAKRRGFCLPEYVDAMVPTAPSAFSRSSGLIWLKTRKAIEEKGWTLRISKDENDFLRFYHDQYVPTAMRKFEGYRYLMPLSEMTTLFRIGFLLQICAGDRVLGSILAAERKRDIWFAYFGGAPGSSGDSLEGVQSAAYYFAIQHGRDRGRTEVNFGSASPYFQDGVYQHKRQWKARFQYLPQSGRCYWFVPNLERNSVRRYLNRRPFIVRNARGLEGVFFYDPAAMDRRSWAAFCHKNYLAKGIDKARFIPLGRLEKAPVGEAPDPASRRRGGEPPAKPRMVWPAVAGRILRASHPFQVRRAGLDYQEFYRRTQWMPPAQLQELRQEKLLRILDHAQKRVPAFRSLSSDSSASISAAGRLRQWPLLDRQDMALHPERYRSVPHPAVETRVCTSGTTSHPVFVWVDRDSIEKRETVRWRGREWWGIHRGDRHTKYWGRITQPRWRGRQMERWLDNAVLFNSYRIKPEDSERCYRSLRNSAYFYGYATVTLAVAQDWWTRGWFVPPGWLKAAIVTADMISDEQKKLIERVFGCPVVREYGCTEFHEIAMECPEGGWHLDTDRLWIEFINEQGKPCKPLEPGRIVLTDLDNVAMPLIRYPIGDIGSFSDKPCPCGRRLPLLDQLFGRQGAFLELPSGGRSNSGLFSTLIDKVSVDCRLPCLPWQATQTSLDQVELLLSRPSRSPVMESEIQKRLALIDPQLRIRFRYADTIPCSPSGKRTRFVSLTEARAQRTSPSIETASPLRPEASPLSPHGRGRPLWPALIGGGLEQAVRVRSKWRGVDYQQFYRQTPRMPIEQLRRLQQDQLIAMLLHAKRTVPHFQSLLKGFDPARFSMEWFRRLPLMDREEMALRPGLYRTLAPLRVQTKVTTSGTTSHPLTIWVDGESIEKREIVRWRGREWWGLRRGDRHAHIWGREKNLRWRRRLLERWLENSVPFDGYHFTPGVSERCYEALRGGAFKYAYGFASVIAEMAGDWLSRNRRLPEGCIEAVIITADLISDSQKQMIWRAFGCPAISEYGSTEFHEIAFQCPEGGWHMDIDRLLIEFLNDQGQPARPQEPADLVISDLDNKAMPLIRYPIGDRASYSDQACRCGRTFPLLHQLWGRTGAFLELPQGGRASSLAVSSIVEDAYIECGQPCLPWQVIQTSLDRIEIILTDKARSAALERAIDRQVRSLDSQLKTSYRYAESLPCTPNGKRTRLISLPGPAEPTADFLTLPVVSRGALSDRS